jgi:hypothetical protein
VLVHAYYFDAATTPLFVRPARALGTWFDRVVDPHVIDAGVREAAISAQWLGHLFRSFQTGLVRAYALSLAFGVACFVAYYALVFGAEPVIVTAFVLGPILDRPRALRLPRRADRAPRASSQRSPRCVRARRLGGSARSRRIAALAGASVHGRLPSRLRTDLVLARAAARARYVQRGARAARTRAARHRAQLLVLQGAMNGLCSRPRTCCCSRCSGT